MNRKSTKVLVETWRRFLNESEEGNKPVERKDPLNADDFNEIKGVNEPPTEGEPLTGDDESSELSDESVIEDYEGDT